MAVASRRTPIGTHRSGADGGAAATPDIEAQITELLAHWQDGDPAEQQRRAIALTPAAGDRSDALLAIRVLLQTRPHAAPDPGSADIERLPLTTVIDRSAPAALRAGRLVAALPRLTAPAARQLLDRFEPLVAVEHDPLARDEAPLLLARAELGLICGDLRDSTASSAAALDAATRRHDPLAQMRAQGLSATLRALNGEYQAARHALEAAQRLAEQQGVTTRDARELYPIVTARSLIAAATFDVATLQDCMRSYDERPSDPLWIASSALAGSMADLILGELARATARLTRVLANTQRSGVLDIVEGFCLGLLADIHLASGAPMRALGVVEGQPAALGDHVLCFSMQRATAMLQLGRIAEVVPATDDCVRMGPRHCLRTYAPLLLRRTIAFTRLGRTADADRELAEAIELIQPTGSLAPYLNVPLDDFIAAVEGLHARSGMTGVDLPELIERVRRAPRAAAPQPAPALSPSELAIAAMLGTAVGTKAIAQASHLSVNTVKSHLRAIYRKLGVRDRQAAVAALHARGILGGGR